jgi:hypothetical protein
MSCCGKEIVLGRFEGVEGHVPTLRFCPFECVPKTEHDGKPERFKLRFLRYQGEDRLTPKLRLTWRGPTEDLWHKYNREWLKAKEAVDQGATPKLSRR